MVSKLPTNIRFGAFERPVLYRDVRRELPKVSRKFETGIFWTAVIALAVMAWLFVPALTGTQDFTALFNDVKYIAGSILILLCALPFLVNKSLFDILRIKRFAEDNGLAFLYDEKDPVRAGMIFNQGHSRVLRLGFAAPLPGGRIMEIANYRYVIGAGKDRREVDWGYIRIELSRQLPHMVLDGRRNNFFSSNLPKVFDDSQRLKLEGNFSDYFDLYVPSGYEKDALYVLTPDVMALLLDDAAGYDMEITGDQLFLYVDGGFDLRARESVERTVTLAQKVQAEFEAQTDYYADERIKDHAVNVVAEPGRALKSGVNWIGWAWAVILAYFLFSEYIPLPNAVKIALIIATLVFALVILIREIRRNKKLQKHP